MRGGRTIAIVAIAWGLLQPAADARAEDTPRAPWIEIDLGAHLRFDRAAHSDSPGNRISRLYIEHGDLQVGLHATGWLALRAHLTAEGLRPPLPGRDAWLRGLGLYAEELFVEIDAGAVGLVAGKFNPGFGVLHDEKTLRGIGATAFVEDYKLSEMLGFSVSLRPDLTGAGLGRHELAAQVFLADTTVLNHAFFTTPAATDASFSRLGDRRLADGGVGNTGRLDNVVLSLSGRGFDLLPDLGYAMSVLLLRASPAGLAAGSETRDQTGYSVALDYKATARLGAVETRLTPLLEWTRIRNPGGNPGLARYVTLALGVELGPWEAWLAGTRRDVTAVPDRRDARDRLITASLDRAVTDWLRAGIGYRYQRVAGVTDHVVGLRLWFTKHIDVALR